jgi:transposase
MAEQLTLTHERVDDLPLLLGLMQRLGLPELLDRHLGNHGHHEGFSNGWLATIWLTYILAQGDHRKSVVQEWAERHRMTLERFVGLPLRPVELSDDRLGIVLHRLAQTPAWEALEAELWPQTTAVYPIELTGVRLDSTTAYGYHTPAPDGLMQLGHSKDHRPDLPQFKMMAAAVEGTGHWLGCDVLPGQRADDPLYLPLIARVRATLAQSGVLYAGDSKMAALATRASIVQQHDYYLTVLPRTGESRREIEGWIAAAVDGTQPVSLLWEDAAGPAGERRLLGYGYERERELATVVDGERVAWRERVQVIRSLELARAQSAALETRLAQAAAALRALTPPPGRGRRQITEEVALEAAVAAVLTRYRVADLLRVTWAREETAATQLVGRGRGGPERATCTVVKVRYVITGVGREESAIEQQRERLGWRVQVTNGEVSRLSLVAAVLHYRGGCWLEQGFHRFKDRPLGIRPLFVRRDDQIIGLTRLLSLGMRVLTIAEMQVRRGLAEAKETLVGLYAGQPRQATAQPTTERLLEAFVKAEITLTRVEFGEQAHRHITPLPGLLTRVLNFLGLSPSLYARLAENSS